MGGHRRRRSQSCPACWAPRRAPWASFCRRLVGISQYTRPATFRGMDVPPVLLSGNHAAVADWRRKQSLERTARLRPDLLEGVEAERGRSRLS